MEPINQYSKTVIQNGALRVSFIGQNASSGFAFTIVNAKIGDKIYFRTIASATKDTPFKYYQGSLTTTTQIISKNEKVISELYSFKNGRFHVYVDAFTSETDIAYFDNMMWFNLTTIFGAGKEPTKEQMDRLINYLGYFNGSKTISIGRFI